MYNLFTFLLLAIALNSHAQVAQNIIDEQGMTWATYGNSRIVVSQPGAALFLVNSDSFQDCVKHENMVVYRTECEVIAASKPITAVIDLISGHTAIFITTNAKHNDN